MPDSLDEVPFVVADDKPKNFFDHVQMTWPVLLKDQAKKMSRVDLEGTCGRDYFLDRELHPAVFQH